MEPLTMASATLAFNALKKGFSIGRDIESMAGDLSRWMSALSDVEQAEKEAIEKQLCNLCNLCNLRNLRSLCIFL